MFKKLFGIFSKSEPEVNVEFDEDKEAKIVLTKSKKQIVVPKYTPLREALDPDMFSCMKGYCGTCTVYVEEGMENLSEKSSNENVSGNNRRACQTHIVEGIVKIKS